MTKPTVQEAEPQEPRKLNMEEKRKLEKLLIADIDSTAARFEAATREGRDELVAKLARTPSAEAKKLYGQYQLAAKQREEAERTLRDIGYGVTYNGELTVTRQRSRRLIPASKSSRLASRS
jgi:hypothetical protein